MSRPEQFSDFDFPEVCLHWKLGNNISHNGIETSPQTWLSLGFLSRSSSALSANHCAATTPLSRAAGHIHHCSSDTHHVTYNTAVTGSRGRQQSETFFRIVPSLCNSFKIRIRNSNLNASSVMMHHLALLLICKLVFVCCSSVLGRKLTPGLPSETFLAIHLYWKALLFFSRWDKQGSSMSTFMICLQNEPQVSSVQ